MIRRIRPAPTAAYLANPHKGCCTFQRFNCDPLQPGTETSDRGPDGFVDGRSATVEGYLPSTVAYCRWYWRQVEPEGGRFDFAAIEQGLERAAKAGQTLAIRLMPFDAKPGDGLPDWYAKRYPVGSRSFKSTTVPIPVYDSPQYLERWGVLHHELGRRFDGHPLLESVDMAYIGPWGEGDGECSPEQCRRFAAMFAQALPNTPRIALIEGPQLPAGLATGSGWRCDCFGDLRAGGAPDVPKHLSFNHMYDAYPREVIVGGARDTWQKAPVHLEVCHVCGTWFERGYDIDFIIEQGWKYHGTYFMPKSSRLPEPWIDKLRTFCRKLGYRFILRQAVLPALTPKDKAFRMTAWIENVGVAPLYRSYPLVVRLRQDSRVEYVRIPGANGDPRRWLPGDVWLDEEIALPAGLRAGNVQVAVGLVDARTNAARVKFAVTEQFSDGWVDLGTIELV